MRRNPQKCFLARVQEARSDRWPIEDARASSEKKRTAVSPRPPQAAAMPRCESAIRQTAEPLQTALRQWRARQRHPEAEVAPGTRRRRAGASLASLQAWI